MNFIYFETNVNNQLLQRNNVHFKKINKIETGQMKIK